MSRLKDNVRELNDIRRLPVLMSQPRPSSAPPAPSASRLWFWTATSGALILALIFGSYELVERTILEDAAPATLHALHIGRGVFAALALGTWAFVVALRTRQHYAQKLLESIDRLEEDLSARAAELVRSRAFTEHLFDALRDRIVVTDTDGRVLKVNRVARAAVECETECGKSACETACLVEPVLDAGDAPHVHRDQRSGRIWAVESYPVPPAADEEPLVLQVARDITDEKRLEAIVAHQEKMSSIGVLAAGIAHDIGNPLASLSSELEILETEDDPEEMRESLSVLRTHVERIGRTLREMVDFARRRGDDELGVVSVSTCVQDAMRLVQHDRRMRNVQLSVELGDLPPVRIVEDHLVMVMVNLALNALDAMPDGGELRFTGEADEREVRLRVEDTGAGMSRAVLAQVFDPMFTTKREIGGTGLGLTVSQSAMRAAGGGLEVESTLGRGTVVTLRLPVAGPEDE